MHAAIVERAELRQEMQVLRNYVKDLEKKLKASATQTSTAASNPTNSEPQIEEVEEDEEELNAKRARTV